MSIYKGVRIKWKGICKKGSGDRSISCEFLLNNNDYYLVMAIEKEWLSGRNGFGHTICSGWVSKFPEEIIQKLLYVVVLGNCGLFGWKWWW